MTLGGLVSYKPGKRALFGSDEPCIEDLNPSQPNRPEKALGDGVARKDFADLNCILNNNPFAGSLLSARPLFNGNNAASYTEGLRYANTGRSDDHQREETTTLLFHRSKANIETLNAEDMAPTYPPGIFTTTLAGILADGQRIESTLQVPATQYQAVVPSTIPEINVTGYTGDQSGLEEESPHEEETSLEEEPPHEQRSSPEEASGERPPGRGLGKGHGKGPGEETEPEDIPRDSSAEGEKLAPYIYIVREARRIVANFPKPYNFGTFMTIVRKLYPIDSLMPRDERRLSFQVAILVRNDRPKFDKNRRQHFPMSFQLLRIMNDDVNEENEKVFRDDVVPRLEQLEAYPDTEFREISVVRIFDHYHLQDGRNTDRQTIMDLSFPERADSGRVFTHYGQLQTGREWLKDEFRTAIRRLLGAEGAGAATVKMHRFPEESLTWREDMEPFEFVTEFIWKIDHPILNIYPVDWRPTLTFEEAENERERAACAALRPVTTAAEGTHAPVAGTRPTQVPPPRPQGVQAPGIQPQAAQPSANIPQGGAANLSRTAESTILSRLDNIERMLQQAIEQGDVACKSARIANKQTKRTIEQIERLVDNATVTPNFRCPQPLEFCGVEIAAEPRDSYEIRVNRHLNTHPNGGGRPCPMDINCHARLDLMNAGQVATHAIMHNNHRQQQQAPGPGPGIAPLGLPPRPLIAPLLPGFTPTNAPLVPAPVPVIVPHVSGFTPIMAPPVHTTAAVIAPLQPAAEIFPEEPPHGPQSPSVPGSEESNVVGAPRPGANYCGKCHKYINNLGPDKKRAHLNKCETKKRNMKTKHEIMAEGHLDPPKKTGKKRKVRDEDDDGGDQEDKENDPGGGGDGVEITGPRTRHGSHAPRPPAAPAKKARGDGAAKTATRKRKGGEEERKEDEDDEDAETNILGD